MSQYTEKQEYHTVGTIEIYILEKSYKQTEWMPFNTQHDRSLTWFGTVTSIKSAWLSYIYPPKFKWNFQY